MQNKKKTIIIFILVIFLIYGIFFIILPVKSIYSNAIIVKNNLSEIEKYIKQDDYESVKILLRQTNNNIYIINRDLKFLEPFRFIPVFNEKLLTIKHTVNDAQNIFETLSDILDSIDGAKNISKDDILIYLFKNKESLRNLKNSFSGLSKNLNLISQILNISNSELSGNVYFISEALKFLEPFNEHIYSIVGKDYEKRYLLLFQNNTELRPTGGFIGTYGILTIQDSKIKDLFIEDIYHLDSAAIGKLQNDVPGPIAKYLKTPEWYMRDCNFDPDFETSMINCIDLYKKESEDTLNIDGVIALTPSVVGELLEIIGTQHIEGVLFESDNFTEDLQKAVELYYKERGVSHWDRKDIIKSLAESIMEGAKNRSLADYSRMLDVVNSNLEKKNILLYSNDSDIQKILKAQNWSGNIRNSESDYLMIVDSNLASYKSDQFLERNIQYTISEENNSLVAKVEITYKHNGTFSWNSTRYRTYTRILAPWGSQFIEEKGAMDMDRSEKPGIVDTYQAYDKTIFGTFISIEPRTSKTLMIKYKLPDYIKDDFNSGKYTLLIQKQPGTERITYELNILNNKSKFNLNNDKEIIINQ